MEEIFIWLDKYGAGVVTMVCWVAALAWVLGDSSFSENDEDNG